MRGQIPTLLVAAALINSACGAKKITFAGGFENGTYSQIGKSLNKLGGFDVSVLTTKGSQDNIWLLKGAKAEVGMAQLDIFSNLSAGNESIEKAVKVLLPVYYEEIHLITHTRIKKLKQLKGKKVSIGPVLSGTEGTARVILGALKLDGKVKIHQGSTKKALNALLAGKVDGVFIVAGAPIKILGERKYTKLVGFRLHKFKGKKFKFLTSGYFHYKKMTIKAKHYRWLQSKVKTIGVQSALMVNAKTEASTVQDLLEDILAQRKILAKEHSKWQGLTDKQIKKFFKNNKSMFHQATWPILTKL